MVLRAELDNVSFARETSLHRVAGFPRGFFGSFASSICLELFAPLDEFRQVRGLSGGPNELVFQEIFGRGPLVLSARSRICKSHHSWISLQTQGDEFSERARELVLVELRRRVLWDQEEDLRSARRWRSRPTFIGCKSAYGGSPIASSIAVIPVLHERCLGIGPTQTPYVRLVVVARLLDHFRRHPVRRPHKGVLSSALSNTGTLTFFVIVAVS